MKKQAPQDLLVKKIIGILSETEEEALKQWLDESPDHRAYADKLAARHDFSARYHAYRASHSSVGEVPATRRSFWKRARKVAMWAAIWTLPILFSLLLWWNGSPTSNTTPVVPGSSKAMLQLSNGMQVLLGDSRELGWIRIDDGWMAADRQGVLNYRQQEGPVENQKNTLSVPRGGEYQVILSDGTRVHLNSQSTLTYSLLFDPQQRLVELTGEAYFEVAKDAKRPFLVKANGLLIKQYGTKFNVNARSPQETTVALEEGSISVIPPQGAEQKLTPGTVAFWNQEKGKVTLETLNTEPYSAWHRHRFVFDNVSLGEMMETLSLWYDVEVRFKDTHLADLHFSGNISRYEQIDVVLRAIESTVDIHCQLQGHRIEIEPNR